MPIGKLFGDRGYSSQTLAAALLVAHGIHLVTKARKDMRPNTTWLLSLQPCPLKRPGFLGQQLRRKPHASRTGRTVDFHRAEQTPACHDLTWLVCS